MTSITTEDYTSGTKVTTTETIDYDAIGNPLIYRGASMSWFGRQLRTYSKGSTSANFVYDADGLRSAKAVNGTTTTYQYVGDQLFYEKIGENKILYYFYDSYGKLAAIYYTYKNGSNVSSARYHVATNAQGDVIALYNSNGVKVGAYDYDAWGNQRVFVVTQDSSGANVHTQINPETQYLNHIVNVTPFRYRGYYFDRDLGLYYLQSRYYDSDVGRFINTDNITDSGAGILGYNTFMYCGNNPVNAADPTGHWIIKDFIKSFVKSVAKKVLNTVNTIRAKTSNLRGTYQSGATVSGSVFLEGSFSGSIAYDTQGNVGFVSSYSIGIGTPNGSASLFKTITNAPSLEQLEGQSYQLGGSVDIYGVSIGAEYTTFNDSDTGERYSGYTGSCGKGLFDPIEAHGDIANTTFKSINIYDTVELVCERIIEW